MVTKKKERQNRKLLEGLPVVEVVIEPQDLDLTKYKRIGEERTRTLEFEPGKLYVKEIIRPKYGLKDNTALPQEHQGGIVIADLPLLPIYKGLPVLITTDWEPQIPVLSIEYDQAAARALDLSRNDVSMSLLSANGGIPIGFFYEGIHRDNIYLKCLDEEGKPIEDLGNTQVFSALPSLNGLLNEETMVKLKAGTLSKEELVESLMGSTPLKQISKRIDIRWEDPVVPRYNGQRSQRVQCSPAPGIETEKARQIIARRIEQIELPQGYTLHWQGEKSASDESMEYLFKNFPLAIILMIAILIMLFKDYRKPIIIFCSLPMLLVGVVAVMLLTDKTFNFVAIVGTLGLIGMLIKNGIVLMDEITLQLNQGVEPITALVDSAQSRLRPVTMAALTTILGMIPLLPDAMFGSLAASIMGGLTFGTLITLLFIPVLYALFFHIKNEQ